MAPLIPVASGLEESLVFIVGIALTVLALAISAIGVTRTGFPSSGAATGALLGAVGLIVVVTLVGAVLNGRAEHREHREKYAQFFAEQADAPETDPEAPAEAPPGDADPVPPPEDEQARNSFAATCGSCHTLAAAGTEAAVAPSLDEIPDLDAARVLTAIEEGPGTMPAGLLGGGEAEAVAEYVAGAAEQGGGG